MISNQQQEAFDNILGHFLHIFLDLYPRYENDRHNIFMEQFGIVWAHINELERNWRRNARIIDHTGGIV
jgi:hypothetical protein